MVCTGARSAKEARKALTNVVRTLKKAGIIITGEPEMKVVNIVASANLGESIDLISLHESQRSMRGRILYEPEQFPGLIYRMKEPKTVMLIFSSGKLVCTGARKEEDVHKAVIKLHQTLKDKKLFYSD
jgi:transcription initiation factor TFIID TATA-box-binding protein